MEPIRDVLCPVDLSGISWRALQYAAAVGRMLGARMQVLQVLEVTEPSLSAETRRRALLELDQFVSPIRPAGLAADMTVTEGTAPAEILRAADALRVGLIVMGTHGRTGFERFVLGSVTEHVVRKAPCPVLAVPPGDAPPELDADGRAAFRTVVCAVDFQPASMRAIDYAQAFAAESGRLVLVHSIGWPFGQETADMPPEIDALRQSVESAARDRLRRAGAGGRADLLREEAVSAGKPYADILRHARQVSADLIVMGLHSHATNELALLGSITRHVLHDAPCPVLTVGS
jgi:nucleotide-binding universal stress UspA family protein